jgi:hypothetical protein
MKNTELKRFLFFGLIVISEILSAQTDFRTGFIIENSGDTLFGEIDYRGDLLMSSVCKFKDYNNNVHEYFPSDIKAFRFIGSKYYVSREVNDKKVFLEYLINGEINIYYLRDDDGDHYYLDKKDIRLTEISYEEGIKQVNNKQVFYKSTKHYGLLRVYMQDAPGFDTKIKSIEKPEHRNLIKLAEDYHNVVCGGEKCIIYEKKQPLLRLNLELVSGVIRIENFEHFDSSQKMRDKYFYRHGIIAHFWMPRINEKIYIKTGLLYSKVEGINNYKYDYFKVPIHICYMAPKSYLVRPSVSASLLLPSYSGGVSISLNKRINIGVQSWIYFFPNGKVIWMPSELMNYSVLGSILIEF